MQSLITHVDTHRAHIRESRFFRLLRFGDLDHLRWMWQLLYMSEQFIRTLALRVALSGDEDEQVQDTWNIHLFAEILHPGQLRTYLWEEGFYNELRTQPTLATKACTQFVWNIAAHGGRKLQALVLNRLYEGVALDTFTQINERLEIIGKLRGPYFEVHEAVDEGHMAMADYMLDDLHHFEVDELASFASLGAVRLSEMLDSWC